MRRILVDHAWARNAAKRGGGRRVELELEHLAVTPRDDSLEALDEALMSWPPTCRAVFPLRSILQNAQRP